MIFMNMNPIDESRQSGMGKNNVAGPKQIKLRLGGGGKHIFYCEMIISKMSSPSKQLNYRICEDSADKL